jgi:hypothetical protein
MTKEECLAIMARFHRWNAGTRSESLAAGGPRQPEDDIYDERRNLLLAATRRLREIAEQS